MQMGVSFCRGMLLWARDGFRLATSPVYKERASICAQCHLWQSKARLGLGKCGHTACGCTKAKLKVASQACPLGKWAALQPSGSVSARPLPTP